LFLFDLILFLHSDSPWIGKLPRAYQALGESRNFLRASGHSHASASRKPGTKKQTEGD
jgi:hypothetical protein